ncbi:MAG: hypothetical protein U0R19_11550 [Bryobacteraceae bacterium]
MSYELEKNGAIEFLAPGSKNPYFVLNLSGIEIVSVLKQAHGVSVELVFKGMSLKPGGAAIKELLPARGATVQLAKS